MATAPARTARKTLLFNAIDGPQEKPRFRIKNLVLGACPTNPRCFWQTAGACIPMGA
jgi:hypothetical protein